MLHKTLQIFSQALVLHMISLRPQRPSVIETNTTKTNESIAAFFLKKSFPKELVKKTFSAFSNTIIFIILRYSSVLYYSLRRRPIRLGMLLLFLEQPFRKWDIFQIHKTLSFSPVSMPLFLFYTPRKHHKENSGLKCDNQLLC